MKAPRLGSLEDVHRLIWRFFPGVPAGERPFLFRFEPEAFRPCFYTVSETEPEAIKGWELQQKPYTPQLQTGEHLHFSVRVNPVVCREGKRYDVVMNHKWQNPSWRDQHSQASLEHEALTQWLATRGTRLGFSVDPAQVKVKDYEHHSFKKRNAGAELTLAIATLEGSLTVTEAAPFTRLLAEGLGHAKAYGCGLMLVKRS